MDGQLLTVDGSISSASPAGIEAALSAGAFFWLDLIGLDDQGVSLLKDTFRFHPLAVDDAAHFGARPKADAYDRYAFLVFQGAKSDGLVEVHVFYSTDYLVTIHAGDSDAIAAVQARWDDHSTEPPIMAVYRVVDALVDTFFPVLAEFDERIDELEDDILAQPTDAQLGTLFAMKRRLVELRKTAIAERDMAGRVLSGVRRLPGMTAEVERYFRDLYDHLVRVSDLLDSYRDLLSGAMDTHLSTVSNRLNIVMKQLTVITTIFLPLTFITGFFGQNFAWMTDHWINTGRSFLFFGVGLQIGTVIFLVRLFRQRGWLQRF